MKYEKVIIQVHIISCMSLDRYFFNMDISLIMALICMKSCIHNPEICFEGSLSQNVDIGLSFFVLWYVE